jgi:hypothetical protein
MGLRVPGCGTGDVVVIGSHDGGCFSRLITGPVEGDLLRSADFSVLLVG